MKKFVALVFACIMAACLFGGCAEQQPEAVGDFMTLRAAYDDGLITRDDIMELRYHAEGAVYELPEGQTEPDSWVRVDYTPREEQLAPLDVQTAQDIKSSYYALHPERFLSEGQTYGTEILDLKYYGQVNGYYMITLEAAIWPVGDGMWTENYDGIVWWQGPAELQVFSYYE